MRQPIETAPLDLVMADIQAAIAAVHTTLKLTHGHRFADAFVDEHRTALLNALLSSGCQSSAIRSDVQGWR